MSSSGSSAASDDPADQTWDEWTEEAQTTQSLFDATRTFNSPLEALQFDKATFGIDFVLLGSTLDFFERIRLINYIRATKPDPASLKRLDRNASFLQDDQYLKPVLQDDPLLQVDFDDLLLPSTSAPSTSTQPTSTPSTSTSNPDSEALIAHLRTQLSDSNQALESLKKLYISPSSSSPDSASTSDAAKGQAGPGERSVLQEAKETGGEVVEGKKQEEKKERDDDSHYFESYQYNEIHEIMLKDTLRTLSYRQFLTSNPAVFKGKTILDVGCGSGILSMFCAQAGAKRVYAVDASDVAYKAERNVKENGWSDVVKVIKGKIEEIEIPEKVDVIVSEWMGYFLLYESMLDSVLHARDRFLSPTGIMAPSQCTILLSLFSAETMQRDRVDYWKDVYGFKMPSMVEGFTDDAVIETVGSDEVVSEYVSLQHIHTQTTTAAQLEFLAPFSLTASTATPFRAFCGHFDTFFTTDGRLIHSRSELVHESGVSHDVKKELAVQVGEEERKEVFFTTAPSGDEHGVGTHWKQTLFMLKEPLQLEAGDKVEGQFRCSKNPENSRELVVEIVWKVNGGEDKAQVWKVR